MRRFVSLLCCCVVLVLGAGTRAIGAPAAAPERTWAPEELRADFEQMYRQLQQAHFNLYAFIAKRDLDREYVRAAAQLRDRMTLLQAKTHFQLFAAKVRMGHTRVASPMPEWQQYLEAGGASFPLAIRIVDGRTYVAANLSGVAGVKPGNEIIALDGVPMRTWLERTERHVSAETSYMAHSLMEYDFALYLWIERGARLYFDLDVRDAASSPRRARVPARTAAEMREARTHQPPALDLEHPLREARMLADGIAYLRPGPFYNAEAKSGADAWDVSGFRSFVDDAFGSFERAHASRLIIDLRGNPGGDSLFSDILVSWIATRPFRFASEFKIKVSAESTAANAERIAHDAAAAGPVSQQFARLYDKAANGAFVDYEISLTAPRAQGVFHGAVFVLIDRQSYSNAVAVAALIQDYRFGTILGEETSDMATTYGAMEQFRLQHTGLMVGYPKARIVRPNGDMRALGVRPDIAIRIPIVQDPADPVLQSAIAIVQNH